MAVRAFLLSGRLFEMAGACEAYKFRQKAHRYGASSK